MLTDAELKLPRFCPLSNALCYLCGDGLESECEAASYPCLCQQHIFQLCESRCVFGLTRLAFVPSGMQTVWSMLTWLWFTSRRLRPVMLFWETWLNISHLLKLCAMGGCFFLLEFLLGFQQGIAGNLRQLVALHGRPWWLNSDWWLTGIGWAVKLASGGGWVLWKLRLIQLADTPVWPWFWVISTALSPSLMRGL